MSAEFHPAALTIVYIIGALLGLYLLFIILAVIPFFQKQ
jgi:hypothetical protein